MMTEDDATQNDENVEILATPNSANAVEELTPVVTHKVPIHHLYQQNTTKKIAYTLYTNESWGRLMEKLLKNKKRKFKVDENEMTNDNILQERKYGKIPPNLIGKPIEEIDDSIKDTTFLFVNWKWRNLIVYRFSATNAFFLLEPLNPIRKFCITLSTHLYFDIFILITILINCVFLTLKEEYDPIEYIFLAIYTLEMIIKLVARGLVFQSYTYLRDPWNWLDVIVVMSSYATIIVKFTFPHELLNLRVLRTFRVFRIFKILSLFPNLRIIVEALLKSLRMLVEVWILILFYMSVVAVFALQIYVGVLRNKCVKTVDWTSIDLLTANQSEIDSHYFNFTHDEMNWMKTHEEGAYWLCGNASGAGRCENSPYAEHDHWVCLPDIGENPNWGYTNFDHFGWSLLSSYQLLTLDFWEDLYNKLIRTSGSWNVLFCIVVVFFGSLYLISLMLAVVIKSYDEEAVKRRKQMELQLIEQKNNDGNVEISVEDGSPSQDNNLGNIECKSDNSIEMIKMETQAKLSVKNIGREDSIAATSITTIAMDNGVVYQDFEGAEDHWNENKQGEKACRNRNSIIVTPGMLTFLAIKKTLLFK